VAERDWFGSRRKQVAVWCELVMKFAFYKMRGISWLEDELSDSQEGLYYVQVDNYEVYEWFCLLRDAASIKLWSLR
jgi:hypothetical protein